MTTTTTEHDDEGASGYAFVPRATRSSVLLGAEICGFDPKPCTKHRIRDLSPTGARVDGAGSLREGATVLVSVGMLEAIGATVMWIRADVAGLKFAEPIDPDAARSKVIRPPSGAAARAGAASRDALDTPPVRPLTAGWLPELDSPYRT